jgi:hypothetical protein
VREPSVWRPPSPANGATTRPARYFVERQALVADASGNLSDQAKAQSNLGVMTHLRGDADNDQRRYGSRRGPLRTSPGSFSGDSASGSQRS